MGSTKYNYYFARNHERCNICGIKGKYHTKNSPRNIRVYDVKIENIRSAICEFCVRRLEHTDLAWAMGLYDGNSK